MNSLPEYPERAAVSHSRAWLSRPVRMRNLWNPVYRLRRSALFGNMVAMGAGTAAGQVVAFAFSPLITRIYSPGSLGLQGLFLSLVSIATPAIGLRYPMAIVVAADEADARQLSRASLLIAFAFSCLCGLILAVAGKQMMVLLRAEALGPLIWLLPPALFFLTLQDVAVFRAARLGNFRLVGVTTVAQSFLANLARVLGGLIAPVAGVLVLVTSLAPPLQAALLAIGNHRGAEAARASSSSGMWGTLRKHYDFPLYRMPTDVLNAMSQSVPVLALTALYTPEAAGFYVLGWSVLQVPMKLVGLSVGNVLYPRYAELDRKGELLSPLVLTATFSLAAFIPVLVGGAWFAPYVFPIIFGHQWREAGVYARWMALWSSIGLASIPANRIAPVVGIQKQLLLWQIVFLVSRVLAVWLAKRLGGNAEQAVAAFCVSGSFLNMGLFFSLMLSTLRYDRRRGAAKS